MTRRAFETLAREWERTAQRHEDAADEAKARDEVETNESILHSEAAWVYRACAADLLGLMKEEDAP